MQSNDVTQRFLFENADVRGELVSLELAYREVLAKHDYPEPIRALLGETLAAAVLLSTAIKFDGLLILQARSSGPLSTLMIECSSDQEVRGIARYSEDAQGESLSELMPDGLLTITIDPNEGQRYQGIVSLEGGSLAEALEGYFANSEQLPSQFRLVADGRVARGFMLQALPADRQPDPEERARTWEHLSILGNTLSAEELISLDNQTVLRRLYHEEDVRLFDARTVMFKCSCSAERSGNALVSLGREDALALLDERGGEVAVDCQFCNASYRFDREAVESLFEAAEERARGLH